jgi:LCP family protein required for cell wall assembly
MLANLILYLSVPIIIIIAIVLAFAAWRGFLKSLLRVAGYSILTIAGLILVGVLANAAYTGLGDLVQRMNTNRLHAEQAAVFPGTATAIGLQNVQMIQDKTNAPTMTPTPTEAELTGKASDTTSDNGVDITASDLDKTTLSNVAALPSPIEPSAVVAITTPTQAPTKVVQLATLPPTNTKRPSVTPIPATETPTLTPTIPPSNTPTVPPTLPPTATLEASATIPATRPLPVVAGRSQCTEKPQPTAVPTPAPRVKANGNDIMNILLIGSDADVDPSDPSFRTDTLMVVSINRTTNSVAMLSIPRDLYACIPSLGMQRINIAYQWGQAVNWNPGGGFGLLQEVILYNLGIPVHYYARIGLEGFKEVVNTLNGVDLAVDCPIKDLRFQGQYDALQTPVYSDFTLDPGFYHMDGSLALWYARMRHSSSDFDRNRRQQQVLRAIWRTAREQGLINKAPELWDQVTKIVDTNLQLQDVLGLAPIAANLKPGDITNYYMVKGYELMHWRTPQGDDVQIPDPAGFFETIRNFYTPPTSNRIRSEALIIEIINGSASKDFDKVAAERLQWEGLDAQAKGAGDPSDKTVLYDFTGNANPGALTAMAKALNLKQSQIVSQPDPNRTVDYRIVLGNDYKSCSVPGFN